MDCNVQFVFWGAILGVLVVWFVKAWLAEYQLEPAPKILTLEEQISADREAYFSHLEYENELLKKTLQAKETAFNNLTEKWANQHTHHSETCPECANFYRKWGEQEYRNVFRYVSAMERYRDNLEKDYDSLVEYVEKLERGFENALAQTQDDD